MSDTEKIILKECNPDSITVSVGGELQEIKRDLEEVRKLLENQQVKTFQTADKIYNISHINEANFGFVVDQAGDEVVLDTSGKGIRDIITNENKWVANIAAAIAAKTSVSMPANPKPSEVFQHFGWLIEEFLRKMETKVGRRPGLRRLSFMSEAYQSSLRYLCFIQMAQLIKQKEFGTHPLILAFLQQEEEGYLDFDYLNLLIIISDQLPPEKSFVQDLYPLLKKLTQKGKTLNNSVLYLEQQRRKLLRAEIEANEQLPEILDNYLRALTFWLINISFLAKYRLVSIKDIDLKYRLGTEKNFVHYYGELHGMYNARSETEKNYKKKQVKDLFTYNKSILLLQDHNVDAGLRQLHLEDNFLSLSPLLIDKSVFSEEPKQTPEIFYFTGYADETFHYAQYSNELLLDEKKKQRYNNYLEVESLNINQVLLDELHRELETIFAPFNLAL